MTTYLSEVENLLSQQGIDYKSEGDRLKVRCLNPEHEDVHPSMTIDVKGNGKCWSCGHYVNVFRLFGVVRSDTLAPYIKKVETKVNNLLQQFVEIPLPEDYEPVTFSYRNFTSQFLRQWGAFTSHQEPWEDRIVFPITNLAGNRIALLGRYIHSNAEPRYMIRPSKKELPIFPTVATDSTIILVEGFMDMLRLRSAGMTNVHSVFGTFGSGSSFREKQHVTDRLASFKEQGVSRIIICYDGDGPGNTAAKSLQNHIETQYDVEIAELPEGRDPDSFKGAELEELKDWLNSV